MNKTVLITPKLIWEVIEENQMIACLERVVEHVILINMHAFAVIFEETCHGIMLPSFLTNNGREGACGNDVVAVTRPVQFLLPYHVISYYQSKFYLRNFAYFRVSIMFKEFFTSECTRFLCK